jgi:hypothetical protein
MTLMLFELTNAANGYFLLAISIEADTRKRLLCMLFDWAEGVLVLECIHKRISDFDYFENITYEPEERRYRR